MNFVKTKIDGVIIIEPKVFEDSRGYFMESFKQNLFEDFIGYKVNFIQDNESSSNYGVLRGLHYQLPPFAQSKLVRVIEGSVLDIAVDIRKGSPTFGQYEMVELSAENKRQFFLPRGFAHGFVVLSERAIFTYKVDNYYAPKHDRGILFNDPDIAINWSIDFDKIILSDKDKKQPKLLNNPDLYDYSINYYS